MHAAVSDFLLDIIQNALEAGSTLVDVHISESDQWWQFSVADNGRGMTPQQLRRVRDPFFTDGTKHRARKVGLGIPFLQQAADAAGGRLELESAAGEGTSCRFRFRKDHLDAPPLGDLPGTLLAACSYPGGHEITITRELRSGSRAARWSIARSELIEAAGSLEYAGELKLAGMLLASWEDSLQEEFDSGC